MRFRTRESFEMGGHLEDSGRKSVDFRIGSQGVMQFRCLTLFECRSLARFNRTEKGVQNSFCLLP